MNGSRVRTRYRSHELLSAEYKGEVVGRVWKDERLLLEIKGADLVSVEQRLKDHIDIGISEVARRNGNVIPEADLTRSFQMILERLNDGQRAMLKAHYHAPGQTMTATELSKAAGYAGWSAANVHYGNIGAMLYDEAPVELTLRKDGSKVFTSYLALPGDKAGQEKEWTWKLRPEVARVIEHLGLHV